MYVMYLLLHFGLWEHPEDSNCSAHQRIGIVPGHDIAKPRNTSYTSDSHKRIQRHASVKCVSPLDHECYSIAVLLCQVLSFGRIAEPTGICVRFEVFTAVTMKNAIVWDVTPCDCRKNGRFGGTLLPSSSVKIMRELITAWAVTSNW
jgi:hypothetical protein